MKKLFATLLMTLIAAHSAVAGTPFLFNGEFAKSLVNYINLNDKIYLLHGSADPSAVATTAPKGSLYMQYGASGLLYVKQDAGSSTNWTLISPDPSTVLGPASATDNALVRFDGTTGKLVQNGSATLSDAGLLTTTDLILSGLTASTVPYLNGSKQLTSSAVTPTELGYLSGASSSLQTQLNAKEPTITAGLSTQYWRGDKTWQLLDTSAVPENGALYFTDARARAALSAASPLSFNGTTGEFSIPAATSGQSGYLTSADWSTFNGKQASGNYLTAITGDVSASGPGAGAATVNSVGSKTASAVATATTTVEQATNLNQTNRLVMRDNSGDFAAHDITANAFIGMSTTASALASNPADCAANQFATTIDADGDLTCSQVGDSALSTSYLKADGTRGLSADWNAGAHTITASTFSGALSGNATTATTATTAGNVTGTVAIANGGTGQTAKAAAFDALSPMTASGDIIYGGASGTGTRLAKGSDGQVLTLSSGAPAWISPATSVASMTVYTSSGTFTTAADSSTSTVYEYMILGGGGGGGGAAGGVGVASGGGAGGIARGTFTGVAASTGITVTVGGTANGGLSSGTDGDTGNSSSIGSPVSVTCTGGSGGDGQNIGTNSAVVGGAGGSCSGGSPLLSITGGRGGTGWGVSGQNIVSGFGANSAYGNGGNAVSTIVSGTGTSATGGNAVGYGAGGGGAYTGGAGGTGAGGLVIFIRLTK